MSAPAEKTIGSNDDKIQLEDCLESDENELETTQSSSDQKSLCM